MITGHPKSNEAEMGYTHARTLLRGVHCNRPGRNDNRVGSQAVARHVMEDILAHPLTRRCLGWLAVTDDDGRSRFERISETYDRSNVPSKERLKWALPHLHNDLALTRSGANKETAKTKLFHHHPTVRALALELAQCNTWDH